MKIGFHYIFRERGDRRWGRRRRREEGEWKRIMKDKQGKIIRNTQERKQIRIEIKRITMNMSKRELRIMNRNYKNKEQ